MDSDLEKYVDKYSNVPIDELKKLRAEYNSDLWFEAKIKSLHDKREWEKKYGRRALRTQPLAHILSVTLQPQQKDADKPLVIYGHIYVEIQDSNKIVVHELYKRERDAPEILGTHGRLTLNGPEYSCWPDYACMPLFKNRINVELFDETHKVFATTSFDLDDSGVEDDYEQVKSVFIDCEKGSLEVQYVTIPFGVHCRIELRVCARHGVENHDFVNVNGKIVARYGKTYGNYSLEESESLLFEKQNTEFQKVEIDSAKRFHLSRCWVSLPAYSSLVVGIKLSEFETRRNIVDDTIELPIESSGMTTSSILLDNIAIKVNVAWFSPELLGRRGNYDYHHSFSPLGIIKQGFSKEEVEEMDIDKDNESSDGEHDDVLSASSKRPCLRSHQNKPWSSPAIEIFSVVFCGERSKEVQIYGSIEILSEDRDRICFIFKKDEHAVLIFEYAKSTSIPDGSRVFDDCISLQMKIDIKDIENSLTIRGLVDWAACTLDTLFWHEKQLCSIIPGEQGGFVAIHYSIFSKAVYANIKVLLDPKTECGDLYPKVWGSIIAHYNCYDYSSRYQKDYYRHVLFRRIQGDEFKVNEERTISLSKSDIVVPSYSDLVVNVQLFGISEQLVSCVKIFKIGEAFKIVETSDYLIRIELEWCEIK